MDWELVKRWNQVVAENDVVYHLGDFGDSKYLSHLNGEKIFPFCCCDKRQKF